VVSLARVALDGSIENGKGPKTRRLTKLCFGWGVARCARNVYR